MKELGETIFDILYIISIISMSFYIMSSSKKKEIEFMGYSLLILGFGDAFHLIPRIVSYKFDFNFVSILGIGKLITSITMTAFYVLLYYVYIYNFKKEKNKFITCFIWILMIARIVLCMFLENGWLSGETSLNWSIIRNIPFIILGLIIMIIFFKNRKEDKYLKFIWLYIFLSFAFYIPVIILSSSVKMIGVLMIPKTLCYLLIAISFVRKAKND